MTAVSGMSRAQGIHCLLEKLNVHDPMVPFERAFFHGTPEVPSLYIDALKQINIKLS
jgi:hypothetical protein